MKTIKILGTNCSNCKRTEAVVKTVVEELNIKTNIIKVENIKDIMMYDVMSTPALVINEKVVIKGRVPSFDEVKKLLKDTDSRCESTNINDSCCNPNDPCC